MQWAEVIEHFGGRAELADQLGLVRQTVYAWGKEIPYLRQCQIEVLTGGKLRAERLPGETRGKRWLTTQTERKRR